MTLGYHAAPVPHDRPTHRPLAVMVAAMVWAVAAGCEVLPGMIGVSLNLMLGSMTASMDVWADLAQILAVGAALAWLTLGLVRQRRAAWWAGLSFAVLSTGGVVAELAYSWELDILLESGTILYDLRQLPVAAGVLLLLGGLPTRYCAAILALLTCGHVSVWVVYQWVADTGEFWNGYGLVAVMLAVVGALLLVIPRLTLAKLAAGIGILAWIVGTRYLVGYYVSTGYALDAMLLLAAEPAYSLAPLAATLAFRADRPAPVDRRAG